MFSFFRKKKLDTSSPAKFKQSILEQKPTIEVLASPAIASSWVQRVDNREYMLILEDLSMHGNAPCQEFVAQFYAIGAVGVSDVNAKEVMYRKALKFGELAAASGIAREALNLPISAAKLCGLLADKNTDEATSEFQVLFKFTYEWHIRNSKNPHLSAGDRKRSAEEAVAYKNALDNPHGEVETPPDSRKSHMYLRGLDGEKLTTPIHIHYDSFKSAFKAAPNAPLNPGNAFDFIGTFLVTISSPNFGPKGHTNRVSGLNYRLSRRGVVDGVVAHVEMVLDTYDKPLEGVLVGLREDGSVVALGDALNGDEPVNLDNVWFSFGDTVFLDGNGEPCDDMNRPQPLPRQQEFMLKKKQH
jgi:hypothetical protein